METFTKRRNSSKRKISFESDEETKDCDARDANSGRRQSSRIYVKQHKPKFRLPSRDEIWKDIPPMKSKKINNLKPKKTVNNFTKVHNNYNFDDYEDTSDDVTSSDESSESEEEQKRHRIKNYHKRIQPLSSSSDEEDTKDDSKNTYEQIEIISSSEKDNETVKLSKDSKNECSMPGQTAKSVLVIKRDSTDSDASELLPSSKRNVFHRKSVLESDSEDHASIGKESYDDDQVSDPSNLSASDSDMDDTCRSAKLKSKKDLLFQKFKELQAKRKKTSTL